MSRTGAPQPHRTLVAEKLLHTESPVRLSEEFVLKDEETKAKETQTRRSSKMISDMYYHGFPGCFRLPSTWADLSTPGNFLQLFSEQAKLASCFGEAMSPQTVGPLQPTVPGDFNSRRNCNRGI